MSSVGRVSAFGRPLFPFCSLFSRFLCSLLSHRLHIPGSSSENRESRQAKRASKASPPGVPARGFLASTAPLLALRHGEAVLVVLRGGALALLSASAVDVALVSPCLQRCFRVSVCVVAQRARASEHPIRFERPHHCSLEAALPSRGGETPAGVLALQ